VRAAPWLCAGAGLWASYTWGSYLCAPGAIWRGPRDRRAVALTFDDGPDPETTPRVLDALGAHGVRATFFLVGRRARQWSHVARRIAEEGHDLGNHTLGHRSLWLCGPRATAAEVKGGHDAIAQASGQAPRFFRPPWGLTNLALYPLLRELATPCVFWSAQPEGQRAASAALQVERCRRRAAPGAIFDLHDADGVPGAGRRLLDALPALIRGLRDDGYVLAPLHELL
jgi:peptidoglycan/xylan/chitin deacetylase (PgdA/CDA1 family)